MKYTRIRRFQQSTQPPRKIMAYEWRDRFMPNARVRIYSLEEREESGVRGVNGDRSNGWHDPTPDEILATVRRYVAARLSVFPVATDGSKAPDGRVLPQEWDEVQKRWKATWKPYQTTQPTDEKLIDWYGKSVARGIAIAAGEGSGNLEVIDGDDEGVLAVYRELIRSHDPVLYKQLTITQTGSGCNHFLYRCEQIEGNLKLAMRPVYEEVPEGTKSARQGDDGRWYRYKEKTLIETRGQGGYIVAPGGPLCVHDTRRPYLFIQGDETTIPTITIEQRELLHNLARALNECEEKEEKRERTEYKKADRSEAEGLRPGDDYNMRGNPLDVLLNHGWTVSRKCGSIYFLRKPGKKGRGHQATLNAVAPGVFYCFSTSAAPFEDKKGYSPFQVYAILEHNRDFSAAARALTERGYGTPSVYVGSSVIDIAELERDHAGELEPITDPDYRGRAIYRERGGFEQDLPVMIVDPPWLTDDSGFAYQLDRAGFQIAPDKLAEWEAKWDPDRVRVAPREYFYHLAREDDSLPTETETSQADPTNTPPPPPPPPQNGPQQQGQKPAPTTGPVVTLKDFYAHSPSHTFIYTPTGEPWSATSVNSRIDRVKVGTDKNGADILISASQWLDQHRAVEQMSWMPGEPLIIRDKLIAEGGWFEHTGARCFNLYRPPLLRPGNASDVDTWLNHIVNIYPEDWPHILAWLAHRVQRPQEKINHALVLGGGQGIGKDTLLEPVKSAVGSWNWLEVGPHHLLGRFNGFARSVILRISEARDLGDIDRFGFYERMKIYTAAPPDTLRIDEKFLREYQIPNITGVVITTNHTDGLYLPSDDRRHYVAWSEKTKEDFDPDYWVEIHQWLEAGGKWNVAAYLAELDIAEFDPKAPPPHSAGWKMMVDAGQAPECSELSDIIDALGKPDALTLDDLIEQAQSLNGNGYGLREWLNDRKNRRSIPHRLEEVGYVRVQNDAAKDLAWIIGGRRRIAYAKRQLTVSERLKAVMQL